jgi:maleate isomerase
VHDATGCLRCVCSAASFRDVHLRTLTSPSVLTRAVASLREASALDCLAYASTTTAYAIGRAAEVAMVAHLRHVAGVPVVSSGLAATRALKTFGVHRVALIHPPWFDDDMPDLGGVLPRARGRGCHPDDDDPPPGPGSGEV